jgi:hypothetical protein
MKRAVEVFAWTLVAFSVAYTIRVLRPAPLGNDAYQYLSVADNFCNGHGLATSLVYFDTERSHGLIPAPMTWFPPGYPMLVGSLCRLGADPVGAARLVSCLSFSITAGLLAWTLSLLQIAPLWRWASSILFVANAVALQYASSVSTDSLFMMLSTASVAALVWAEDRALPGRVAAARVVIAFFVAGVSYWLRYAGLFLIAGLAGYALCILTQRGRGPRGSVWFYSVLLSAVIAASLMLRNWRVVGSWMGGNNMPAHHPFRSVMSAWMYCNLHLILGEHSLRSLGAWPVLVLLAGIPLGVLLIVGAREQWMAPPPRYGWDAQPR